MVLLDDLDAQPRVQAAHGQIIGDAAAAHDDGVAHLLLDNAKMLDELGKVLRIGSDIDIVPRLQREAAVRDMHGAAALHHAHKHAHPRDLIQAVERDARQLGILAHMDLYDLHTALGKGIPPEK